LQRPGEKIIGALVFLAGPVGKPPRVSYIDINTMKSSRTDTIAAVATPIGEGGISVIRVSGIDAFLVVDNLFKSKKRLEDCESHTAHFGKIIGSDGGILDEVVATVFREPNSYTGENTVEIGCHGGLFVTRRILESILEKGTRHAEPGEFTKRAFLNGRIDLAQAEAVADLIHAHSDAAHKASVRQLEGALSERIRGLRTKLVETVGLLELELDFVEDDLEFVDKKKLGMTLKEMLNDVNALLDTFKRGRIYREGIKVVIAGAPNAGKSSLLNALLNTSRAIVTDVPGTTRDTIEEAINIGGISFRLVDTAGLRETSDIVEKEGVRRTKDEISISDLVVLVIDASRESYSAETQKILVVLMAQNFSLEKIVLVLNKIDLLASLSDRLLEGLEIPKTVGVLKVSAKTGIGLDELRKALMEKGFGQRGSAGEATTTVTSTRHFDALQRSRDALVLALSSVGEGKSNEFIAVDLRNALDSLGEIIGEVTTEDILNSIFAKFCIGK
jgi:tRNA modification GTPase